MEVRKTGVHAPLFCFMFLRFTHYLRIEEMESNQGNNDGVESFVVPEEQIVDNLDSEACLYSAEDRTLYDRCMLHK